MADPDAHAQSQAKGHFERARQKSEAGDFDGAAAAFAMAVQQAVGAEFNDLPLTAERIAEATP